MGTLLNSLLNTYFKLGEGAEKGEGSWTFTLYHKVNNWKKVFSRTGMQRQTHSNSNEVHFNLFKSTEIEKAQCLYGYLRTNKHFLMLVVLTG